MAWFLTIAGLATLAVLLNRALAAAGRADSSQTWKRWLGGSLIVLAVGLGAYGALDDLLGGMRVPGEPSNHLLSIPRWSDAQQHAVSAVDGWWRYHERTQVHLAQSGVEFATAPEVTDELFLVDMWLIVPGYLFASAIAIRAGQRLLSSASTREQRRAEQRLPESAALSAEAVSGWWYVPLGVMVVADVAENLLLRTIVATNWTFLTEQAPTLTQPLDTLQGSASGALVQAVFLVKWLKTLGALGVVGALLLLGLAVLSGRTKKVRWGRSLVALRGPILVLVAFALLFQLSDQGFDAIRRWNIGQAVATVLLALALAFAMWDVGRRMLRSVHGPERPRRRIRNGRMLLVAVAVALGVWLLTLVFPRLAPRGLWIVCGLAIVVALLSIHIDRRAPAPPASAQLAFDVAEADVGPDTWDGVPHLGIARGLAAAFLVVFGLAVMRSSLGQLAYAPGLGTRALVGLTLLGGVVLPVLAMVAVLVFGRLDRGPARTWSRTPASQATWGVIAFPLAASILWAIAVQDGMWRLTGGLGTLAVLVVFLIVLLPLLAALLWLGERYEPPALFRLMQLRRIPALSLLVVWAMLSTLTDPVGFYNVRVGDLAEGVEALDDGVTARGAFDRWYQRNLERRTWDPGEVMPMVFVSSSGGGIRAAYWTARVMDCLFEIDPGVGVGAVQRPCVGDARQGFAASNHVFMVSGVSGGSLGLTTYAAYLTDKAGVARSGLAWERPGGWVVNRLGDDYLAPTLAWEVFVESARSLLRFRSGMDRAEVLERAWERSWPSDSEGSTGLRRGVLETWSAFPEVPLLVLNGTTVNEGCRFVASALNAGLDRSGDDCLTLLSVDKPPEGGRRSTRALAATLDLVDFLCEDEDVALSTAALLSARFPGISPTGRITDRCHDDGGADDLGLDEEPRSALLAAAYLVDGGYLDTSGASAALELWTGLAPAVADRNDEGDPCVVPFFVQIDNGYDQLRPPGQDDRPNELSAPSAASEATRGARASSAKAAVAISFNAPFPSSRGIVLDAGWPLEDRFAYFLPRAHPGVQAPLGWTLSRISIADLEDQLNELDNARAFQEVRSWLGDSLTCAPRLLANEARSVGSAAPVKFVPEDSGWHASESHGLASFYRRDGEAQGAVWIVRDIEDVEGLAFEVSQGLDNQGAQAVGALDFGEMTLGSMSGLGRILANRLPGSPCRFTLLPSVEPVQDYGCGGMRAGSSARFELQFAQAAKVVVVSIRQGAAIAVVTARGVPEMAPTEEAIERLLRSCCLGGS